MAFQGFHVGHLSRTCVHTYACKVALLDQNERFLPAVPALQGIRVFFIPSIADIKWTVHTQTGP